MNEDTINDFKQFITATVTQATSDIRADFAELREEVADVKSDVNRRFDDLDLKLDTVADAQAEQLDNHKRRITKLEKVIA